MNTNYTATLDIDPAIELRATQATLREYVARVAELEAALREITTTVAPKGSHAEIMARIARAVLAKA